MRRTTKKTAKEDGEKELLLLLLLLLRWLRLRLLFCPGAGDGDLSVATITQRQPPWHPSLQLA